MARACVRDVVSGSQAAQALSRLMVATAVAPVVAPLIGGQVLRFTDWRGLFVTLAVLAAAVLVAVYVGLPETLEQHRRITGHPRALLTTMRGLLADRGCEVTVVPAQTPASDVLALKPDGVFLSNGPGDPEPCDYAIAAIRELLDHRIPIYGICLGHQLLGLAIGAKTMKMPHGHHGANHPVQELDGGRVLITSQNHGFCIDEATLPADATVTHRSLFDGTNQGIALADAPAYSFQGHPEASPGPHDMAGLFDRFIAMMAH